MKQYEKIFIPNDKEQHETTYLLMRNDLPFPVIGLDEVDSSVVLTMEELEKMLYFFFKEGESLGAEAERKNTWAKLKSPDFKATFTAFLQAKGINTQP